MNMGFKRDTTKRLLLEMGITIRTAEQTRAKKKNINYFDIESENMAWILGFLASDGTISKTRNTIKIGLSIKDKEILERIRQELQLENEIYEYTTNKGFDVVELAWNCQKHKQALATYGILPSKTFYLTPPNKLNKKFQKDYLRGYFDGDGSVSYNSSNKAISFSITSGTKEILEWIINFLYEEYNIPKVNIYETKRLNTSYYFNYSINATKQIYHILYDDLKEDSLYLKRKYIKYTELIK